MMSCLAGDVVDTITEKLTLTWSIHAHYSPVKSPSAIPARVLHIAVNDKRGGSVGGEWDVRLDPTPLVTSR